jgi:hypothetical protein
MPGVIETAIEFAGGNLFTGIGLLALGMLAYWTFDERRNTDSAAGTVERVGERADSALGGIVGAFGSLVTVVLTILITVGNQIMMVGVQLNDLVEAPVVIGHIIAGALAFGGFRGYFPINAAGFGYGFLIITVAALWARYSGGAST